MAGSGYLGALLIWTACLLGSRGAAAVESCPSSYRMGVDTSLANNSIADYLGRAAGQTFLAEDTLIASVAAFRVAVEGVGYWWGLHAFITETDSTGRPLTFNVVGEGRDLSIPEHDDIHPTEFRWNFDPPIALPHRGLFAVFFAMPVTQCGAGVVDLLTADMPGYGGGHLWWTHREDLCRLRPFPQSIPYANLVYSVDFCRDVETKVQRKTWGALKLLYR